MLRLVLALLGASVLSAQTPCPTTPVFGRCEIHFELSPEDVRAHPNPYLTVQLNIEFRSPKFRTFLMPAFWDGGNQLVVRFSPVDDGEWTYKVVSNIARWNETQGKFVATPVPETAGFIRPRNVHHWAYADSDRAHLWIGDSIDTFALDRDTFTRLVDARAGQKFTHLRASIMDSKAAFKSADQPNPDFFRNVDERIAYVNSKGLVADVVLAGANNQLADLFPTWQQRARYLQYVVARYSSFNITWNLVRDFETYEAGRDITKELGLALKKADPYNHPRGTIPVVTSAPLLQDGWMDHVLYQSSDDQLGAIEHQLFPVPFVNANFGCEGAVSADVFRHHLWNATMNGQSPTYCRTSEVKDLESPGAKAMTVWYNLMAETRYWELEPYFDLDGGRAIALPGVEYIVYVEQPSGPVEVRVEKHGYEIRWIDPATGQEVPRDNVKSEKIVLDPPDRAHDWVLQIYREGRKEGLMKSYKFESQRVPLQEVEIDIRKLPYEIGQPSSDDLSVRMPPRYEAKLTRQTRGTRSMMYLWTGEVAVDSQGFRVLGTGGEGTMKIPPNLTRRYPATINVRLYGMNANGKVYSIDHVYGLTQ